MTANVKLNCSVFVIRTSERWFVKIQMTSKMTAWRNVELCGSGKKMTNFSNLTLVEDALWCGHGRIIWLWIKCSSFQVCTF